MFEIHGWITIREMPVVEDEENIDQIAFQLKKYIERLNWDSGLLKLYAMNGEYQINLSGFFNHQVQEINETIELYHYVSKIAPGSYGLLYLRNDEDMNGFENEFQVYVLARGSITRKKDTFLSPFVPVCEDRYEG